MTIPETMAAINRQLAQVNPGYTAEYQAAPDATVDDDIGILLHGVATRWAIEIGDGGDYFINEYGFDAQGEVERARGTGCFRPSNAPCWGCVVCWNGSNDCYSQSQSSPPSGVQRTRSTVYQPLHMRLLPC
jgi:hypothetical protein